MLLFYEIVLALLAFLFGIIVFSFINVLIYRLPKKISFVRGFSFCPACSHRLYPRDLFPIFSWLFLRGKCRYCQAKISPRYFLVELLGGVLALTCVHFFDYSLQAATVFALFALLTAVAFVDIDTMEIPNGLVVAIAVVAVVSLFVFPPSVWWDRLLGVVVVSLPLLLIAMIIPGAFGGGDVKLMAAVGLFIGWKMSLLAFFFAILGGGVWGIWLLASKQKGRKGQFAFGPFLCLGIALSILWGTPLLDWYIGLWH